MARSLWITWLPVLVGINAIVAVHSESVCAGECAEPTQVINSDTRGHCCWPGQAWSDELNKCVGVAKCNEHQDRIDGGCYWKCHDYNNERRLGTSCVCMDGFEPVAYTTKWGSHKTACCQPGQAYSEIQGECVGAPTSCPPQTAPSGNRCKQFQDNGDGTVTDLVSGYIWQREPEIVFREYHQAREYCKNLTVAGKTWRLPLVKELVALQSGIHSVNDGSLEDSKRLKELLDLGEIPVFGPGPDYNYNYWSSEERRPYEDGHLFVILVQVPSSMKENHIGDVTESDKSPVICIQGETGEPTGKVAPGPRGCGCAAVGGETDMLPSIVIAGLGLIGLAARFRRRRTQRSRHKQR